MSRDGMDEAAHGWSTLDKVNGVTDHQFHDGPRTLRDEGNRKPAVGDR